MKRFMTRDGEAALALDCHQLAELSRCGASLVEALRCVADLPGAGARAGRSRAAHARSLGWQRLAAAVEGGQALSDAMTASGPPFAGELAARVRAGEAGGALAEGFDDMERSLRRRSEHGARLKRALVYPSVAAAALLGALGFLVLHVVPALADGDVVHGAPGATGGWPWHAAPLLALSSLPARLGSASAGSILATVLALGAGAGAWCVARSRHGRGGTPSPLVGGHVRLGGGGGGRIGEALELSRILSAVARLHGQGLPVDEGLALAARDCRSLVLAVDLSRLARAIRHGETLGSALGRSRAVPDLLQRFVAAGESSGSLDAALERASMALEREALAALDRRETLAGPLVLMIAGALLLWIIVSIVLPVYDAALQRALA